MEVLMAGLLWECAPGHHFRVRLLERLDLEIQCLPGLWLSSKPTRTTW